MKKDDTIPQEEKFKEMFDMTLESDHDYFGDLENINFFGLICTAAQGDFMRKIFNNDIVMFNTEYEDEDAVLIVVQIPVNVNEDDEEKPKTTKFVANRVMKMRFLAEKCLVQLDLCETTQENEDKFVYLKMIKKVGGQVKRLVARDSKNKIMWIRGRTDISPLTYREFNEGRDMESGSIIKAGIRYIPPFNLKEEDVK